MPGKSLSILVPGQLNWAHKYIYSIRGDFSKQPPNNYNGQCGVEYNDNYFHTSCASHMQRRKMKSGMKRTFIG